MRILFTFCLLLIALSGNAQRNNYLGRVLTLGSSASYLQDRESGGFFKPLHQFAWHVNAAMSVTKRSRFGVETFTLYANSAGEDWLFYNVAGVFAQYDYFTFGNHSLYAEISYSRGDFCSCDELIYPIRRAGLDYFGWGLGAEVMLPFGRKHLFLDVAFFNRTILRELEHKHGFNLFLLGMNYKFGRI